MLKLVNIYRDIQSIYHRTKWSTGRLTYTQCCDQTKWRNFDSYFSAISSLPCSFHIIFPSRYYLQTCVWWAKWVRDYHFLSWGYWKYVFHGVFKLTFDFTVVTIGCAYTNWANHEYYHMLFDEAQKSILSITWSLFNSSDSSCHVEVIFKQWVLIWRQPKSSVPEICSCQPMSLSTVALILLGDFLSWIKKLI